MSIATHEEVDTVITGQITFVVSNGIRELARVLPGGRVLVNSDVTIAEIVTACMRHCENMQAQADRAADREVVCRARIAILRDLLAVRCIDHRDDE
jgi:hypothetical protein